MSNLIMGRVGLLSQSSWLAPDPQQVRSGRVGLVLGFLVVIYALVRGGLGFFFLIRVKTLARIRPIAWSGRVFSGVLGRVYRVWRLRPGISIVGG
jgi:hypothetical protein